MDDKNIQVITLKDLLNDTIDGSFNILLDVQSDQIVWGNNSGHETGHLRLINSNAAVRYKGKLYEPAHFSYTLPSEDGSKIGNTSITISAIDQSIIEIIRKINKKPKAYIEAFYAKTSDTQYIFSKMFHYEFLMTSVTWDNVTAKWDLIFDPSSQVNVPKDTGTNLRCPAVYQDDQ